MAERLYKAAIFDADGYEVTVDDLRELSDRPEKHITGTDAQNDNDARATWAAAALVTHIDRVGDCGDWETQISDQLADLRHLCDALGVDYEAADETAALRYEEEIYGERR